MDTILKTFIDSLFASFGVPVTRISLPCTDFTWIDQGLRHDILSRTDFSEAVNHLITSLESNTIYRYQDEFLLNYVSARTTEGDYIFLGPVLFEEITPQRFEELFQKFQFPEQMREPLQNFYHNICHFPAKEIFDRILLAVADTAYGDGKYKIVRGDAGRLEEWQALYDGRIQIPEKPFGNTKNIEGRYQAENALLSAVSTGAEQKALKHMEELLVFGLPSRMEDELRDMKDLLISLNTLLRKTAEFAGVHPARIDHHSNRNVIRIEQAAGTDQCKALGSGVVLGYCEMVREVNFVVQSLPVRNVISRVNADLTENLSLKALARELNVNASYLSTLFRKETGMSLTEYVNHCRITQAKRLLLGSDLPIKDIALQCGLSDMYYFSRLFKRMVGISPRSYRNMRELFSYQELFGLFPHPLPNEIDIRKENE